MSKVIDWQRLFSKDLTDIFRNTENIFGKRDAEFGKRMIQDSYILGYTTSKNESLAKYEAEIEKLRHEAAVLKFENWKLKEMIEEKSGVWPEFSKKKVNGHKIKQVKI